MKALVIIMLAAAVHANGQSPTERRVLTGNLRFDLLSSGADTVLSGSPAVQHKSPLRAALYSAVIPGAGEFYTEAYWRSAAFFAAEVALWVVYSVYDSKGDRQTTDFEKFADAHWSVVKYAQWMEQHAMTLSGTGCSGIVTSSDPNFPPWERVDWSQLNMCEESIGRVASTGFSHRLPRRPDQQYYELIGKYEQYNAGWDDSNATPSDYLTALSARFIEYRNMRGNANDLYSVASTASYVLVANHLFSALDAALSAAKFNHSVAMEAHLRPVVRSVGIVEFVPTASITLTF